MGLGQVCFISELMLGCAGGGAESKEPLALGLSRLGWWPRHRLVALCGAGGPVQGRYLT